MEAPGVADLPVSVLSIAGGFRQGKSFLLGYIVRYLEQLESGKPAEGINTPDAPLRGFPWKYGESKVTTGILVWGKVFKVTTKNHGQVAVILIDTEGTFDDTSTVTGNASIMSLSMIVSSVQIYNVSQNINQNDLQHLQLFSSYARVAQGEGCGQSSKPFQKMVFLVRDWMYPDDHQYGLEGGNAFLNTWLNRGGPSKCADHITSTFDNIECFLMPHPGDKVKKSSFDGRLSGLSDEFKEHLNDLISSLVSPDKLVLKEVNGKPLKCRDLPRIFQEYFETCKGGQLDGPCTHFEATADATNQSTLEAILRTYTAGIEEVMQDPACDIHQLWKADEELRQLCSSKLEHASLMGAKPHQLEAKMSKEIDASFRRFERSMLEIQKSKDDDQARLNDLKRQCEEEQDKITKGEAGRENEADTR
ncbi:atlastin-2-like [Ornithodoros turicata]|uniref:atlastin-2-like n=1 Tax=Ornithodoros turicata TaxID=34597 RepID=UPI0031390716